MNGQVMSYVAPMLYGQVVALTMAVSNFSSGQINRYSNEHSIWIANNSFQYLITLIIAQLCLNLFRNKQLQQLSIHSNNSLLNEINKTPSYTYILIGVLDVLANLLVSLSLRNTSITHYSMIANSICLLNLLLSMAVLTRSFVKWNYLGSVMAFVPSVGLALYSATVHKEYNEVPYNLWLGNVACLASVMVYSVQNVMCDWISTNYEFDTFIYNRNVNLAATISNFLIAFADGQIFKLCYLLTQVDFLKLYLFNALINSISYFIIPHFIMQTSASFFGVICLLSGLYTSIIDYTLNGFSTDSIELLCYASILMGALVFNYGEFIVNQLNQKDQSDNHDLNKQDMLLGSYNNEPAIDNLITIK